MILTMHGRNGRYISERHGDEYWVLYYDQGDPDAPLAVFHLPFGIGTVFHRTECPKNWVLV